MEIGVQFGDYIDGDGEVEMGVNVFLFWLREVLESLFVRS
jgi:hypothetical protein